jgi:hypothetical protein
VSALSHFLESEGLATTGISLVREHTEQMQPPRALWVPFELGRPFGALGDAAFQRRVLEAALALLDAGPRPVLVDFPDDAPISAPIDEAWACPVSFPPPPLDPEDLGAAVAAEIGPLAPWYEESQRKLGRTSVGGQVFTVEEAAAHAVRFLGAPPEQGPEAVVRLKGALEDLKAFYSEAAAARPGGTSSDMADWLWRETALGRLMFRLAETLAVGGDEHLRYMALRSMVPRAQAD